MRALNVLLFLFIMIMAVGFAQPVAETPASKDNILYSAKSSGGFNNCEYQFEGNTIRIFAKDSTDPGVYFERINKDVSALKYFTFAIKGSLLKQGQWAFPVVQLYDSRDDDYTPSITKTSFTVKDDEYVTVSVPLEGKIKKLFKIQFILVTDRGSWNIEVKDPRLE